MGFGLEVSAGSYSGKLQISDYSVREDASPTSPAGSFGSVGTFDISVRSPDRSVPLGRPSPLMAIREFGPSYLLGCDITLSDGRKGFTLGRISAYNVSHDGGMITYSGESEMGRLNVYNINAAPYTGTLAGAFDYYASLGGFTGPVVTDDAIQMREVVFPGWSGELWFHMKQLAAAQSCDISLVSGILLLRPIRKRIASQNRDTSRTVGAEPRRLARSIEIYQYNNRPISNELVFPPGGWSSEVTVMNVNAGETEEYTLQLSASLSSFIHPIMVEHVDQNESTSSVYTIVSNDGIAISPALWAAGGGLLEVTMGETSNVLNVKIIGATGIRNQTDDSEARNFSVALGSPSLGNRYSTMRIIGSGVAYNKKKLTIPTGLTPAQTENEVGITIDNPFISTANEAYGAGARAARSFSGARPTLSGNVTSVNRRGDSGQVSAPSYAQVAVELGARSYGQVKSYYLSLMLTSYAKVRAFWIEKFRNDDVDQVFGNVQGARILDRASRRWYRVRSAVMTAAGISFSEADDDLTHGDMQELYGGKSYADNVALLGQFSYKQVDMIGMWDGN